MTVKIDKTVAVSIVLHVLVIGWGLFSFSTRALPLPEEDTVAVDVISADQLAKVMAGIKTGKKENPKPLVEKVAEAKPVDETVGKITEKAPVVTDTTPPPQPKPVEKPVEKKPDPPKPLAEAKPKEEPKPVEKKPDTTDPIAEALKKEEKKPPPKPQAAVPPPQPPKPKDRTFDQTKIAALLDKRDPSRQAAVGDTLNSNAALGTAKGKSADNSATWGRLFKEQVDRCWKPPYGGIESQNPIVAFDIRLKRDGTLESAPIPEGTPATPYLRVLQESALRAIIECQPYKLPAELYDEWKYFTPEFAPDRRS
ncbi:MAG TPA: protein TolA [Bradyrhizobium sp.]|nr:protein TolA [Bradyrhizobium sp.]